MGSIILFDSIGRGINDLSGISLVFPYDKGNILYIDSYDDINSEYSSDEIEILKHKLGLLRMDSILLDYLRSILPAVNDNVSVSR